MKRHLEEALDTISDLNRSKSLINTHFAELLAWIANDC